VQEPRAGGKLRAQGRNFGIGVPEGRIGHVWTVALRRKEEEEEKKERKPRYGAT
jgi:hypothetical protein